uniref:Uncharacterized protein n=1 Tax=Caudovirales sp. ctqPn17 TaxID=2825772 RepID=A0A8S5QE69_9CAUD|nr:MAG TPA: hypothetical protein [Caudovirales sp. ctqPn17]
MIQSIKDSIAESDRLQSSGYAISRYREIGVDYLPVFSSWLYN